MSKVVRYARQIALATAVALPLSSAAQAPTSAPPLATVPGALPQALCGRGDVREPGIQGDVPAGAKPAYNCGVTRIGQLPRVGGVQGIGKCAYVRPRGGRDGGTIYVIDVSNPARPVEVGSFPIKSASETFRVVAGPDRAVLVSGSSVYDVGNCLKPVLMGEIEWPEIAVGLGPPLGGGGGAGILPHDLRINHAGTKVYASQGLWEADISNLRDPKSWKVIDHRCDVAMQVAGPWQSIHRDAERYGMNLCADQANPTGANGRMGSSGIQASLLWPIISHGPTVSGDNKRVYIGEQAGGAGRAISGERPRLRVFDVTQQKVRFLGDVDGAGHSTDWFSVSGREYVLHANEGGTGGIGPATGGDPCRPHPRHHSLGWAFDALISDVTDPARARNVSRLSIAINEPENCAARKTSGTDPWVAYHIIDNPMDAKFAAVNFGSAGLRIYDIRKPESPAEVAYYNHGPMAHGSVGHYDAARGLIYAAGNTGLWILQLQPQVRRRLGV